ncbi:hypothetical protein [Heyndrickxia acidicola]|uniref:Uncharacterized protein n=1 Tax=Heyndrickxia acidicola TaxID=209389 RepID=A0ABU6MQ41_9BACI|nr:hypothetical protein [Heyndrickxia acidicola]MED1205753.1 hypothetical protein [Heyndrickxia acidicola]
MIDENTEWPNKVQYSIWDTSVDQEQLRRLRQALESYTDLSLNEPSLKTPE